MAKTNYYEYDFYKTLGQILREKRIEQGMALDDAASAIGKTIKTVQRYETGDSNPTPMPVFQASRRFWLQKRSCGPILSR